MPTNVLLPNQALGPGDSLVSPSGRYQLLYQADDGNLVLLDRDPKPPQPIWDFGTEKHEPGTVTLGTDSNLVVRDKYNVFIQGTHQKYDCPLVPAINAILQDDGNFVVYSIWATFNTVALGTSPVAPGGPNAAGGGNGLTIAKVENYLVNTSNIVEALSAVVDLF